MDEAEVGKDRYRAEGHRSTIGEPAVDGEPRELGDAAQHNQHSSSSTLSADDPGATSITSSSPGTTPVAVEHRQVHSRARARAEEDGDVRASQLQVPQLELGERAEHAWRVHRNSKRKGFEQRIL